MEVQNRVAEYIRKMGIKQTIICEKTGIRNDTLSQTFAGKRKMTADEFEKICVAIEKTPNDFMCLEESGKGG